MTDHLESDLQIQRKIADMKARQDQAKEIKTAGIGLWQRLFNVYPTPKSQPEHAKFTRRTAFGGRPSYWPS